MYQIISKLEIFFSVYVSHSFVVRFSKRGSLKAFASPKCTVHMLIDLKHNFKK